ncbi:putative YAH1-ferredoxin of the mitochondrial matrix [Rhodotorula diobovata]|uniref:Putative YAH1-ferredoxin of the mitochondrial matrix n=1 Tax=Rhodotorula diobovata TaxID=5288 RepID=A0A5C5FTC2_9BASI|nr:putative YAH1-ferredoxin of the mitochondrial matrix [Rhodotorula diobovata]
MATPLRSFLVGAARLAVPRSSHSSIASRPILRPRTSLVQTAHRWAQPAFANAARSFHSSPAALHGGKGRPKPGEGVTLHFKRANGEVTTVEANVGDDIVDVSWEYDLDIEAACEKSVACSTCHVILEEDVYDKLEEPDDDENDMLDLAFGLTDTSRLGCQVKVTKDMDGTTITLPSATRNLRVDGSKPTPH